MKTKDIMLVENWLLIAAGCYVACRVYRAWLLNATWTIALDAIDDPSSATHHFGDLLREAIHTIAGDDDIKTDVNIHTIMDDIMSEPINMGRCITLIAYLYSSKRSYDMRGMRDKIHTMLSRMNHNDLMILYNMMHTD